MSQNVFARNFLLFSKILDAFFMISTMVRDSISFAILHFSPIDWSGARNNVHVIIDDWMSFFTDVYHFFFEIISNILDALNPILEMCQKIHRMWKLLFNDVKDFVVMVSDTILKGFDLILTPYKEFKQIMEKNLQVVIADWNLFYNDVHKFLTMVAKPFINYLELMITKYYKVREIIVVHWFCFLTGIADCFVSWTTSDVLVILYGGHIFLYFYHFYTNDYFIEYPF